MAEVTSDKEAFLAALNERFGEEDLIRRWSSNPDAPPIHYFVYRDTPEKGMITGVTYGLSSASHPDWKLGRPELVICVKSTDLSWIAAMAYFAHAYQGQKAFTYQSLFTMDEPISDDSGMTGYFTFAPAVLEADQHRIELPSKTVNLVGMYPIYPGEAALLPKWGLEKFWKHPKYDPFDVKRPDLSAL